KKTLSRNKDSPDPPLDSDDQADLEESNKRFQALYKEIGDTMEYQTLHYAVPFKTRLTPEIEDAVKHVYLQIRRLRQMAELKQVTLILMSGGKVEFMWVRHMSYGKDMLFAFHREELPVFWRRLEELQVFGQMTRVQLFDFWEAAHHNSWHTDPLVLQNLQKFPQIMEIHWGILGIMGSAAVVHEGGAKKTQRKGYKLDNWLPNVTRFLAKFAGEFMGAEQFATVVIQRNGGGKAHRDFHNFPGSRNWLCPLTSFEGGGLWTQLEGSEEKEGSFEVVEKEVKPSLRVQGRVRETKKGEVFSFNPMMWHEVQPHAGDRVMVIAYTPRLSNLDGAEADYLKDLGFPIFGEEETQSLHDQVVPDPPGDEERVLAKDLRQAGKLVEREAEKVEFSITQMLDQAARRLSQQDRAMLRVCLKAASETNEPDYEDLLESLEGELQVVHTVPLSQVKPVVDRWHAAIRKELDNLFNGGTLVEISREEARCLERQGVLRLVPSKGVHTLKTPANKNEKYKRKYRLVLCGNLAAPEEQFGSLYAGGASAETFRTVLAVAAGKGWLGATADITGAFLLAPWPEHLHRYA
ncbi:TY2B-C, partial [Symbiodinium pilosum]